MSMLAMVKTESVPLQFLTAYLPRSFFIFHSRLRPAAQISGTQELEGRSDLTREDYVAEQVKADGDGRGSFLSQLPFGLLHVVRGSPRITIGSEHTDIQERSDRFVSCEILLRSVERGLGYVMSRDMTDRPEHIPARKHS